MYQQNMGRIYIVTRTYFSLSDRLLQVSMYLTQEGQIRGHFSLFMPKDGLNPPNPKLSTAVQTCMLTT